MLEYMYTQDYTDCLENAPVDVSFNARGPRNDFKELTRAQALTTGAKSLEVQDETVSGGNPSESVKSEPTGSISATERHSSVSSDGDSALFSSRKVPTLLVLVPSH